MKTFITIMLVLFLSPVQAQLYGAYENDPDKEVYNPGTPYSTDKQDPNNPFQKTKSKSVSNRISTTMYQIQENKASQTKGTWMKKHTENKYRTHIRVLSTKTGGVGTFGKVQNY